MCVRGVVGARAKIFEKTENILLTAFTTGKTRQILSTKDNKLENRAETSWAGSATFNQDICRF